MTLAKSVQFRKSDTFQVCEKSQLVAKCGKENTAFLPASARGEIKGCPAEAELGHLATLPPCTSRINNLWPQSALIRLCLSSSCSPFHFFTSTNFPVSKIPRQRQMSLLLKTSQCKCDRETKELGGKVSQLFCPINRHKSKRGHRLTCDIPQLF